MTQTNDPTAMPPIDSALLEAQDRRRPGRANFVAPALIPLLRQASADGVEQGLDTSDDALDAAFELASEAHADGRADTDPFRGILVSLMLSVPMWVVIFLVLSILF